jgi:tetratricopeptide (TPR) repeat protein
MPQTVTCPNCNTLLRSKRAIPAGTGLRCPGCRSSFTAPGHAPAQPEMTLTADEPESIERPSAFGAPFVIAIAVSLVLGLSVVTAAVIFALRPAAQPVQALNDNTDEKPVTKDKDDDKEREKLAVQAKQEEENKKREHARLVARAKVAMAKGDFAEAEKLYNQALDLIPDADTRDGLVAAVTAAQTAGKTEESEKKRQKDLEELLAAGRKAVKDKDYVAAVRKLESANALDPSDKAVREALEEARTLVDNDKAAKERLAAFQARIDDGKAAMKTERFADAVKEFQAAARLMPDDLEAAGFLKQAENKLINLADKDKKQAAYANLMDRARAAQVATRYNEAVQAGEAALRLIPNDRDAEKAVRDAKAALKRARADNATRLAQADEAAKLGKVEEARQLLNDATKAWAEDTQAEKQLRNLDRLVNNAEANQNAYTRAIQQAEAAMLARDWALAVSSYNTALRLNNTDPNGLLAAELLRANRELKREASRLVDYEQAVKRARSAMSQREYGAAVSALNTALRNAPNAEAVIVIKTELIEARYLKAMADGKRALQRGQYRDAVRAFDAALAEKPDDRDASNSKMQAERLARGSPSSDTTPKTKTKSKTDLNPKDTTTKDVSPKDTTPKTKGKFQPQ